MAGVVDAFGGGNVGTMWEEVGWRQACLHKGNPSVVHGVAETETVARAMGTSDTEWRDSQRSRGGSGGAMEEESNVLPEVVLQIVVCLAQGAGVEEDEFSHGEGRCIL
jgi:hypothetical protein